MSTVATLEQPRRIFLHRRIAHLRPGRIDLRPSPAAIVGPLAGVLVGLTSFLLIAALRGSLPLPLLVLLLLLAVILLPLSGMGLVYALYGTNVIFDAKKETATFQQGIMGLGLGTRELVPFHKIVEFVVEEAGEDDADPLPTEEFTQWQVTLVKTSGRRLRVAGTVAHRAFELAALRPVVDTARALADLTDKPLVLPDIDGLPEPVT